MKSELVEILESFGFPVYLQGTLAEDAPYPPTFFTFWTLSSPDAFEFDDQPTHTAWEFQVVLYSSDPRQLEEVAAESRKALKAAGFIPQGKGQDIPSDEPTHTGWVTEYKFISEY